MNKAVYFVLLALFLFTAHSAKFNIASTSVCTETSKTGFCTRWEQNGTVQQQTLSCFSGHMIVLTKEGYKTLDELRIGESILGYDREKGEVYTKVRGWFHRDSQAKVEYLNVTFSNGEDLIVSEKHNIAFKNNDYSFDFRFAEELTKKDELFGSENYVAEISTISETGLYAPMTYNSNYFVFTSKSEDRVRILAHDYANIRSPQTYQPLVNIAISTHEYFKGKQQAIGIHPAAQWLMEKFSFLLE